MSAKSKLNRAWHLTHRLGPKAPLEKRLAWHAAHAKVCGCREMPASIAAELKKRPRTRRARED
jgi:hypothetical protein